MTSSDSQFYSMQHFTVSAIIKHKPLPLSNEFCQFCVAFDFLRETRKPLDISQSRKPEWAGHPLGCCERGNLATPRVAQFRIGILTVSNSTLWGIRSYSQHYFSPSSKSPKFNLLYGRIQPDGGRYRGQTERFLILFEKTCFAHNDWKFSEWEEFPVCRLVPPSQLALTGVQQDSKSEYTSRRSGGNLACLLLAKCGATSLRFGSLKSFGR